MCFIVGYPLTVVGGLFGRSLGGSFDAPSRTKAVAREIPSVAWYKTPVMHCVIGGFLPFRLATLCCTNLCCAVSALATHFRDEFCCFISATNL